MKRIGSSTEKSGKIYTIQNNEKFIFSAGGDRLITVWNKENLQLVEKLVGHNDCIWCLAICGNILYSGSEDTTVKVIFFCFLNIFFFWVSEILEKKKINFFMKIWDANKLICLKTLETSGRGSKVYSLAVSDRFLCLGTDDCKIKIWDSVTFLFFFLLS